MVESGVCGKLIHVENLKSKISWHCSLKTEDNMPTGKL